MMAYNFLGGLENTKMPYIRILHICSSSPSLALEGARLRSIMHSCHHHYAHLPSPPSHASEMIGLTWTQSLSLPPLYLFPASGLMFVVHFCFLVLTLFLIKCSTPCTCISSPAPVLTVSFKSFVEKTYANLQFFANVIHPVITKI